MKKYKLDFIEFYITNACNLGCQNCNRLNNHFFAGAWKWKDYKDEYAKWSKILDLNEIRILGGEPFLNPSLVEYVQGIHELWPNTPITIVTNGSYLNKKDYYNIFKECNVSFRVSAHSRDRYEKLDTEIRKYLKGNIGITHNPGDDTEKNWANVYNNIIKADGWPSVSCFDDWENLPQYIKDECTNLHRISPDQYLRDTTAREFVDENNVHVQLNYSEDFFPAPLKYSGDNKFSVYNSDPEEAHSTCLSSTCHHFIAGKVYKCHHMGLLPQFLKQFHVEISDDDLQLLNSYVPATTDMSEQELDNFFRNIKNTMPQCKLCPVSLETSTIETLVKPRIQKLKS